MAQLLFHACSFKRDFEEKMEEQMRKERAEATHHARAAAWEAEKADAQASRVSNAPCVGIFSSVSQCSQDRALCTESAQPML